MEQKINREWLSQRNEPNHSPGNPIRKEIDYLNQALNFLNKSFPDQRGRCLNDQDPKYKKPRSAIANRIGLLRLVQKGKTVPDFLLESSVQAIRDLL